MKSAVSAIVLAGLAVVAFGAESRNVRLNIEPPQPRLWQHWGNKVGVFTGTFDHLTTYRAFIKDPYDRMLEIPLFYFSAPDLSYMETQLTLQNLPEEVIEWTIDAADKSRNILIDIDAADLPLGDFKEMKNKGLLGGAFINANRPALVEMVAGRKAITFMKEDRVGHKYPDYQMLTGTFTLRDRLDRNMPFTLCAWVYTESGGTLLDWHGIGGDHGTQLSFGHCDIGGMSLTSRGRTGENRHPSGLVGAPRWQHVAYVYTGGIDGEFSIYSDGNPVSRTRYDNIVHRRPLRVEEIGTTNAVVRCDLLAKKGSAWVGLYLGTIDHHHWQQLRHWHWQRFFNADWQPEGEVTFEITNLEPGTRYYYRILSTDERESSWGYSWDPSRRWCYGPGVFVTATGDGKPGYNVPEDTRKHFFIGADWGAEWYYANAGPSKWFKGSIGSMQLFDYAMGGLEVRENAELNEACNPDPEDESGVMAVVTDLKWEQADVRARQYRVFISTVKAEVEQGSVAAVITRDTRIENQELSHGKRYFWRVDQLDAGGNTITRGKTWTFRVMDGVARDPYPETGASVNPMCTLGWAPPPKTARGLNLYMAGSEEELAAMTEPTILLKGAGRNFELPRQEMIRGRTYYWKVDTIQQDGYLTQGPVWHFTIKPYFTPEGDTVAQEPLPDEIANPDWGGKMMEENTGHPAISSAGAEEFHMRQQVHGTARMLGKSEEMSLVCEANNFGTTLSSFEGGKWGWASGLAVGCSYGGISKDGNDLLFHEMGHQVFNMLGKAVRGYGERIDRIWLGHADDNVGLGGYNANNAHENMAVNCHRFLKAIHRDEMYRDNYRQYVAIKNHLPGELYIDLDAKRGVTTDGKGVVTTWHNSGGFEQWTMGRFEKIETAVGRFHAVGDPRLGTVNGVTCVIMDGDDALEWDLKTQWALHGNRDFAVEFWAFKNEEGAPGQVLAAWGGDIDGTRFLWGSDDTAYRHCGKIAGTWGRKPGTAQWQHIVQLYRGGSGDAPDSAGPYEIYVNGELVHLSTNRFTLTGNVKVTVGGLVQDGVVSHGFNGALAHVRIYDYDLSRYQLDNHYTEEVPAYHRDMLAVAEKLYVDLDARYLADTPQMHHRPLYAARLCKPWLRSWANYGTLGGRVHNDVHSVMWGYSGSRPRLRKTMGTLMPTFEGADRMVAGFEPHHELLETPPGTIELWLENNAQSDDEVILEWDAFQLTSEGLPKGRQCVSIVFDRLDRHDPKLKEGDAEQQQKALAEAIAAAKGTVYVNGVKISKTVGILLPGDGRRLHLGGHYDMARWNWKRYFNGTIAALRVHKGVLDARQIKANADRHIYSPGNSGVVKPKPDLTRAPVVSVDAAELKKGALTVWPNRGSAGGAFVPGTRGDIYGMPVLNFKGISGVHLGQQLISSFRVPEVLKKGPFTIYAHVVSTLGERGTALLLAWGEEEEGARLHYGALKVENEVDAAVALVMNSKSGSFTLAPYSEKVHPHFNPHMGYFWKPVVLTCDGTNVKYYADGILTNEKDVHFSIEAAGNLMLGGKGNGQRTYLSELKVFGRALSEDEVKSLKPGQKSTPEDCLVAVRVPTLKDDMRVMTLPNTGNLGGSLDAPEDVDHTPNVTEIDGVPCVDFDAEADFLMSTLNTPETLTTDHPFTVEINVHADRANDADREDTLLALAPRVGGLVRDINFCSPGKYAIIHGRGRQTYLWDRPGPIRKWTRLTYVYDGGRRSRIRLYMNGTLVNTYNRRSFATVPGYSMYIGAAFNLERGEEKLYDGAIASLKVYDYVRTDEQIKADALIDTAQPLP